MKCGSPTGSYRYLYAVGEMVYSPETNTEIFYPLKEDGKLLGAKSYEKARAVKNNHPDAAYLVLKRVRRYVPTQAES